jgi:hypothetical protein
MLLLVDKGTVLLIIDSRTCSPDCPYDFKPIHKLTGLAKILYSKCDKIQTIKQLYQYLNSEISIQEILETLQPLLDFGLMVREDESYLSLAVSLENSYQPHPLKRLPENYSAISIA